MKKIIGWHWPAILLTSLILVTAAACFYIWNYTIELPNGIGNLLKRMAFNKIGIALSYDSLKISGVTGKATVLNASLKNASETVLAEFGTIKATLSGITKVLEIMRGEEAIDSIVFEGGVLYLQPLIEHILNSPSRINLADLPLKYLSVWNFKITTVMGDFLLDKADIYFRRVHGDVTGLLHFSQLPWGGEASITCTIPFDLGTASIAVEGNNLQNANLAKILPLLDSLGLTVVNGDSKIALRWSGNLRTHFKRGYFNIDDFFANELRGAIWINNLGLLWKNHYISFNANAFSDDKASKWQTSAKLEIEDSKLEVECAFAHGAKGWGIGLRGSSDLKADIWNVFSNIYPLPQALIPGVASAAFQLRKVSNGLWSGSIETDLNSWKIASMPLKIAKLNACTEGHDVVLEFAGDFIEGALNSKGRLHTSEGILESDVTFRNFQMSAISAIPAEFSGAISGSGALIIPINRLADSNFNGEIEISHPAFGQRHAEHLYTRLEIAGKNWRALNPKLKTLFGGAIELRGSISPNQLKGEAVGTEIPADFLGLDTKTVNGKCSFRSDVSGTLDNPIVTGELLAKNIKLWNRSISILRSQVYVNKKMLSLANITAIFSGGGDLNGWLNFDMVSKKFVTTRIDASNVNAAVFADLVPNTTPALAPKGFFNASFESLDVGDKEGWRFSGSATKMYIASVPVGRISIDGTWLDGALQNLSSALETGGGTIVLQLVQLRDGRYTSDVAVHDVDISIPAGIFRLTSPLNGKLTIDGNLILEDFRPTGRLTVFLHDLSVDNEVLGNAGGEIVLSSDSIALDKLTLDRLGVQASGKMRLTKEKPYACNVLMKNTDLSALPIVYGFRSFHRNDVIVTGSVNIKGRAALAKVDEIDASIRKLDVKHEDDIVVSNKPISCIYKNGIFDINSFELAYKDGIFAATGTITDEGTAAVTLKGRDFSLRALGNLLDIPNWSADGRVSFSGKLSGRWPAPMLDADLEIKDLEYLGRKIPEINGKLHLTREKTELEKLDIKLNYNMLSISGVLPGLLSGKKEPFSLALDIASGPIADLPLLLPEAVSEASGTISAALQASGKIRAPIITGSLNFSANLLRMRGMKIPLKNVEICLNTRDGKVLLAPLKASMGRGSIDGFGEADFKSGNASITAHVAGQKVDLNWNAIEISGASAAVDVSGTLYHPVVRSKVMIPRGRAMVGDMKTLSVNPPVLPFEAIDYKIDVIIPRNFWVKSSFLNAELRADVSILGDKENFGLDGSIESIQGLLFFQRRKFLLENCEIRFLGEEKKFNPRLFVKSVTNIQNTQVYLTLDGTMASLTPRLYSSPPLAESDLLSLLTLGRNMEEAQRSDAKELFENEVLEGLKSTYISGLIGSTISRAFNLDEVFFGSLFDRETGITRSFLRIGKYLGQNIFLAYEGTLSNEGDKTYICEYRLPKGFYINVEVEKPRNRTRFGVKYDWKF